MTQLATSSSSPTTTAAAPTSGLAETGLNGLRATSPEPLPFAPSLLIRSFLLARPRGNILIYGAPGIDAESLAAAGGATRWYLNHSHEAMFARRGLEVPLFVHEAERASVDERVHVRATFTRRHVLDEDFEVIPAPGHTPGATAYLWDSGRHRFLFTGDTIYLSTGEWATAVLGSSDRAAYLESLELIRELDFDVLVPWAAGEGERPYAVTDGDDARRRIDALIERVRDGSG